MGIMGRKLTGNRVGVFATLTNSYALVAVGASENFYRYAPAELSGMPRMREARILTLV